MKATKTTKPAAKKTATERLAKKASTATKAAKPAAKQPAAKPAKTGGKGGSFEDTLKETKKVIAKKKPAAKPVKLTAMENDLLHAVQVGMDSPGTGWLHEISPLAESSNAGVVSSLVKKGLIKTQEEERGMRYLEITPLGEATPTTAPVAKGKPGPVALEEKLAAEPKEDKPAPVVIPLTRKSTLSNPVQQSWELFDTMRKEALDAGKTLSRKLAIAKAVEDGIAFYTARTQYQSWKTANKF